MLWRDEFQIQKYLAYIDFTVCCTMQNQKLHSSSKQSGLGTGKASPDPYTCKLRRLFITDFFCLFQHLDIIFYVSFRERRNNVQKRQIDTFLPARHTNIQGYRVTGKVELESQAQLYLQVIVKGMMNVFISAILAITYFQRTDVYL